MTCQWCGQGLVTLSIGTSMCPAGCADAAIFTNRCTDCRREFTTGRFAAEQCRPCELKEDARYRAEAEGDKVSHTGWSADMRKTGASRKAHALGKKDSAA